MLALPMFPTSSTTVHVWVPESLEWSSELLTTSPMAPSGKQFPSEQVDDHVNIRAPIVSVLSASHVRTTEVAAPYVPSSASGELVTDAVTSIITASGD